MSHPISVSIDIGGTNTRVATCSAGRIDHASIRRYRNAEHPGLEPILDDFLSAAPIPEAICIDLAGPVSGGIGRLTNLDWVIDAQALAGRTGATRVALLNDMQAQGFAVPRLPDDSLITILAGTSKDAAAKDASRLVVNVGTGLNAAPVHSVAGRTLVPAAEAGHMVLQARNDEEMRLLDWLSPRHPTPGVEDVLSGRGLERLYAFVCHDEGEDASLTAAAIMAAFQAGDAKALRAARMFARLLGRYAGDLALATLPYGGVYLVGGVARHFAPHLVALGFDAAFTDKGRFSTFVSDFPVFAVDDDFAALQGCAAHLHELATFEATG